jgi:hypothetical protein
VRLGAPHSPDTQQHACCRVWLVLFQQSAPRSQQQAGPPQTAHPTVSCQLQQTQATYLATATWHIRPGCPRSPAPWLAGLRQWRSLLRPGWQQQPLPPEPCPWPHPPLQTPERSHGPPGPPPSVQPHTAHPRVSIGALTQCVAAVPPLQTSAVGGCWRGGRGSSGVGVVHVADHVVSAGCTWPLHCM